MGQGNRSDRLAELLRETAASFVQGISNNQSLITVTKTNVSPDLRKSTIYVTVLPESAEVQAIPFLNRHAAELRSYAKSRLNLKRLPYFDFELDRGERHRQHLDEISKDL